MKLSPQSLSVIQEQIGGASATWKIDEIGDGNINLIFRVEGPKGQVLVKQAVPYLRCVGESWPLSMKRNYFEYLALQIHAEFSPQHLPKVHAYDDASAAMVMEFFGDHIILRKGVISATTYPLFAEHITDYMARTLFFTSDLFLSAGQKKEKMKVFCDNIDLCKITEDLIFTDPYRTAEQNHWTSPQLDPAVAELQMDIALKTSITEMKFKFLTSTEALIHGDLHTGSIMVNQKETKVIDPEFAFYGPMGFDVGLLLANFLMGYFAQAGLGSNETERSQYESWLLDQTQRIWNLFSQKFARLWETHLDGDQVSPNLQASRNGEAVTWRLRGQYMQRLFDDSIRFAGAEMIRRTLGLAHVADLDTISDPDRKAACERRNLRTAVELLVHHDRYTRIEEVMELALSNRNLRIDLSP